VLNINNDTGPLQLGGYKRSITFCDKRRNRLGIKYETPNALWFVIIMATVNGRLGCVGLLRIIANANE
jgi:hypothetical protein